MDPLIRSLRTSTLTAQVELCRIMLAALESAGTQPDLPPDKHLRQCEAVIRDSESAEDELAILELEETRNSAEL